MKKNYILFIILIIIVLFALYYYGFFENFEGQKRMRKRDGSGILSNIQPRSRPQAGSRRNSPIGGGATGLAF